MPDRDSAHRLSALATADVVGDGERMARHKAAIARSSRTRSASSFARIALLAFSVSLTGCLHIYRPSGQPFEPAPAPDNEVALVYVYHVSPVRSVLDYGERVFVDGTERGLLHTYFGDDCEYLWLHLAPGSHHLEIETNRTWLAPAPKNAQSLELNATAGSVYVIRIETSRKAEMSGGVSVSTTGAVQSHSGTHPAAGTKLIDYSEDENVDDTEIRNCLIAEAPAAQ